MKLINWVYRSFCLFLPLVAWADSSYYCPATHGYIHLGMNSAQVISSCGQPTTVSQSKQAAEIKVPVTQLIYSSLNSGSTYYGLDATYQIWSLPSGSTGVTLQVNIMNDKITSVNLNGASNNATSVCGGTALQVGDSADSVYSACGSPSVTNQTYITQQVPGKAKPETWMYSAGPYQPSFHLTFLNGILQSINE